MMDFMNSFEYLSFAELVVRITLALLFGLLIGIDRDTKNKPVDFRVYMLVCMTSCIMAILSQELYADFNTAESVVSVDLGKIISGVLTGVGFLGAGAIIKRGDNQVIGSATGASIWASGGIGLTIGFGFYMLAFAAFISVLVILVGGGLAMTFFGDKKDKENNNN